MAIKKDIKIKKRIEWAMREKSRDKVKLPQNMTKNLTRERFLSDASKTKLFF